MVIVMKNIIPMDNRLTKIRRTVFEISPKKSVIFLLAIGSITAPVTRKTSNRTVSLMIGVNIIKISTNKPTIPIPFFNMVVDPITASTASDKNPPTMGTKVSTANLAVLILIPSILVDKPYMVKIPIKIVKAADMIKVAICLPISDSLPSSVFSDKLDNMLMMKEK